MQLFRVGEEEIKIPQIVVLHRMISRYPIWRYKIIPDIGKRVLKR